jgi:hypothetical protein
MSPLLRPARSAGEGWPASAAVTLLLFLMKNEARSFSGRIR